MLIQYVGGSTVREWPPYRFTPANGKAQVVEDGDTVINMLTQPGSLSPALKPVQRDRGNRVGRKRILSNRGHIPHSAVVVY
jgi:hypothetical protein